MREPEYQAYWNAMPSIDRSLPSIGIISPEWVSVTNNFVAHRSIIKPHSGCVLSSLLSALTAKKSCCHQVLWDVLNLPLRVLRNVLYIAIQKQVLLRFAITMQLWIMTWTSNCIHINYEVNFMICIIASTLILFHKYVITYTILLDM